MSEELLVNVTPRETRVAVVENGMLQELHIERGSQRGVVGNIYKGKVQRVMPGMQAAFVDIGLERAAFLYANDIFRSTQLDATLEAHRLEALAHRVGQHQLLGFLAQAVAPGLVARLRLGFGSIFNCFCTVVGQNRVAGDTAQFGDEFFGFG